MCQLVLTFVDLRKHLWLWYDFYFFYCKTSLAHDSNTLTGIRRLEEAAKAARHEIISNKVHAVPRSPLDHIFTEDEKIELITREIVQRYKTESIGEKLFESAELERVMFDVVYPLFGSRKNGIVNGRGQDEGNEGCLAQWHANIWLVVAALIPNFLLEGATARL